MVQCCRPLLVLHLVAVVLSSPLQRNIYENQQVVDESEYEDGGSFYTAEDFLSLHPSQFYQASLVAEEPDMMAERERQQPEPVFYRNIIDSREGLVVPQEELPWYSDNVDSVDVWPATLEDSRHHNYLELPEVEEQPEVWNSGHLEEPENWYPEQEEEEEDFEKELEAMLKEKRSSESMEGYRLSQKPAISARKSTKAPTALAAAAVVSTTAKPAVAVMPKAAAKLMTPEKRGMPEIPILRPGFASDPRFSSLPVEARPKRSLKRPVPFSGNR